MASFGCISEFNLSVASWSEHAKRLKQFFIANAIEVENRRCAVFLTGIGSATNVLLRNLLSPAAPTSKTLVELIEIPNEH